MTKRSADHLDLHIDDNDEDSTLPLFRIRFEPIGQRRRWRNVVQGQQFHATIMQLRTPTERDDLGTQLTDALQLAIEMELRRLDAHSSDRINFTIQAHGFTHAFQSVNFQVGEFMQRTMRLDELLRHLAAKLNSNESFNTSEGMDITFNHISMPRPGRGRKSRNVGTKCLDKVNKKKKCIIPIVNDDNLCCARAIVTMRSRCHKHDGPDGVNSWNNLRKGLPLQKTQAEALHTAASVPQGPCAIPELKQFQAVLTPQYQLVVMCRSKPFTILYKGPDAPHQILLLKSNSHYDGCTSFPAFVNRSYFCLDCEKGFNTNDATHHPCQGRICQACQRNDCPDYRRHIRPTLLCTSCNCRFHGPSCKQHHLAIKQCQRIRTCPSCQSKYFVNKKKRHTCGKAACPCCKEIVTIADHRCYIQPVVQDESECHTLTEWRKAKRQREENDEPSPSPPPLMIYADIEAMQMPDRSFSPILLCYRTDEDPLTHDLYGEDCCTRFIHELDDLTVLPEADDERDVIIIFHNLKGFDGVFIMNALYAEQRDVESQLTIGAKVLSFKSGPLTFKDSLCFLPMPLASFPATFGLTELKKGFFPHEFNTPDNQTYEGRIPDEEFYDPDGMSPAKKREFHQWHQSELERNAPFNFKNEMISYCHSDVHLLQAACQVFVKDFQEKASFNPLQQCVTIASSWNLYWRIHHLPEDTIAVEPTSGWRGANVNQSFKALQWLHFLNRQLHEEDDLHNHIRHVRNGGEQTITLPGTSFFVDGYDPRTRTVYEFHGCFWHGCPACHPNNRHFKRTLHADRTMEEVYQATLRKTQLLRAHNYTVIEMWECQWDALLKTDSPAATFVSTFNLVSPLEPRDAFFGGRTGAVALHAVANQSENEVIRYVDVTSLYPWVNKTACYPIGHPHIITDPGHTDISLFFGFAKVTILPPPGLLHPVLPVRSGGKLTFPLCKSCVKEQQAKPMLERSSTCPHFDEGRYMIGTWCTPEIQVAVQQGYVIQTIHEVWHFPPDQRKEGLFAEYVNTWLKIKQEASGWPRWCDTEEKKQQYIHNYKQREGITLEYDKIKKNPGLKALAKLMLNSFWGKFGERQNKPTTTTITQPQALFDILTDTTKNVTTLRMCTDDVLEAVYTHEADNVPSSSKTNIFIAAFTTCWARLKLYSYLDLLQSQVLYYDTDSIIYRWKEGQPSVPLGDYLGDMTDELDGDVITEFVSGGAKNYAYTTRNEKTECKVRGFTLNTRNQAILNFTSMRDHILAELDDPQDERRTIATTNPNFFKRDTENKRIKLTEQIKQYGLVFDKRVINTNTKNSLPYGYHRNTNDEDANLADLLSTL